MEDAGDPVLSSMTVAPDQDPEGPLHSKVVEAHFAHGKCPPY